MTDSGKEKTKAGGFGFMGAVVGGLLIYLGQLVLGAPPTNQRDISRVKETVAAHAAIVENLDQRLRRVEDLPERVTAQLDELRKEFAASQKSDRELLLRILDNQDKGK